MQYWLEDQLIMFLEWLRERNEKKRRSATPESKRGSDPEFSPTKKEPVRKPHHELLGATGPKKRKADLEYHLVKKESAQKSRHKRLRRQAYGRRFPVLGTESTRYWIQGKEYGYLEIKQILQGLINRNPSKQYREEYDRLLESVSTKRFNVADYSYIINLANRLSVTPDRTKNGNCN